MLPNRHSRWLSAIWISSQVCSASSPLTRMLLLLHFVAHRHSQPLRSRATAPASRCQSDTPRAPSCPIMSVVTFQRRSEPAQVTLARETQRGPEASMRANPLDSDRICQAESPFDARKRHPMQGRGANVIFGPSFRARAESALCSASLGLLTSR